MLHGLEEYSSMSPSLLPICFTASCRSTGSSTKVGQPAQAQLLGSILILPTKKEFKLLAVLVVCLALEDVVEWLLVLLLVR